jgi:phosphoribosylamine--glycine ligase
MAKAGVPTAASRIFSEAGEALDYIADHPEPLVVKASGLAGGKGAVVCPTRAEARQAVIAMLSEKRFGTAGDVVVIESFLEGEELSLLAVTNGREVRLLPAAQDHKRLLEGDRGPNTGGMGAYAPVSIGTPAVLERATREVLLPTLAELERRGTPFRGVLYAGLMLHPDGTPQVVEFNCRLGDPETQAVLPLVASGLTALLDAAARGEALPDITLHPGAAVTTVLASEGYPDSARKGQRIELPRNLPAEVTVFHAGTQQLPDGELVVTGGRVLALTAVAPTFERAREASREAAEQVEFEGKVFRRDIGWRESERRER